MRIGRTSSLLALVVLLVWGAGCAGRSTVPAGEPAPPSRKLDATSYYEQGSALFLGVDVRAARVAGPDEFLPLFVVVQPKADLSVTRESFTLELSDRTRLPLITYREFSDDYTRARQDRRLVQNFLETLQGRFPDPPFAYRQLEFYPLKWESTLPRDVRDLRQGELGLGFLYFRLPQPAQPEERFKLLFRGAQLDETFVVDFPVYKTK